MTGWTTIAGAAVALCQVNVDTDQLIPARFMSQPRTDGYAAFLLHDARQDDGDHVLNRHTDAKVLITGRNFGSGSSREAAVYALIDFGIRAVLAPSFGDIFAANAANNGLLAAQVPEAEIEKLLSALGRDAQPAQVDLEQCIAMVAGQTVAFDIDPVGRQKLMNGWDDIDITAQHKAAINDFRESRWKKYPWALPST